MHFILSLFACFSFLFGYRGFFPPPTRARMLQRNSIAVTAIPPLWSNVRRKRSFSGSVLQTKKPFSVPTEKHPWSWLNEMYNRSPLFLSFSNFKLIFFFPFLFPSLFLPRLWSFSFYLAYGLSHPVLFSRGTSFFDFFHFSSFFSSTAELSKTTLQFFS